MIDSDQVIEEPIDGSKTTRTAADGGGAPDAPGASAPGAQESRPGQTPGEAPAHGDEASGAEPHAPEGSGVGGAADGDSADGELAEVEGDLDELVAVAAQRDEYLALAQRTQADFENYRKRVGRESALAQERGVVKLANELLPALDNLDRALEAAEENDPLLDGVRLVRSELGAALARVGVESFSPLGEPFDPALHEAMATAEAPANGGGCGTVVEVYQPGYRLGASIIRPARVVVAA
jgi:molecular chaperone GrpE